MTIAEVNKTRPEAFLNNKKIIKQVYIIQELYKFINNNYSYKWSKKFEDIEIIKIQPFLKNYSTLDWEIFFSDRPGQTLGGLFNYYYNNENMDYQNISEICNQNRLTFFDFIKEIDNLYKLKSFLPFYNSNPEYGIIEEQTLGTLINFLINKLSCMARIDEDTYNHLVDELYDEK